MYVGRRNKFEFSKPTMGDRKKKGGDAAKNAKNINKSESN